MTAGSGIGTEAVWRGNSSAKLLKFGRATLASGKAYIATAPMTVKANEDTTIASIRLERLVRATGLFVELRLFTWCLSFWFFFRCLSHLRSPRINGQSRRMDYPATAPLRDCPP